MGRHPTTGRIVADPMDYDLPSELVALSDHAREVGRTAASGLAIREDSWLRGTSKEFAVELASHGWLGMTWPEEYGGGGRSALERFVVFEGVMSGGAALAWIWLSDRPIRPRLLRFGTPAMQAERL